MSEFRNINRTSFSIDANLDLPGDEVQLWRIDLDSIANDEVRWKVVLSADEAARAARYRFARDRQRYVATRAWLRMILGNYLRMEPKDLRFVYSKKEKPSLGDALAGSGILFNVSHSGGMALLAFTREREIGVDIEKIKHDFELEAIARRFFSAREQEDLFALPVEERVAAFFRCWTRKEAYIKATGDGLSLPLSQFDVSIAPGVRSALLATRPDGSEAERWRLQEVGAGDGYIAALCVRGHDWRLVEGRS